MEKYDFFNILCENELEDQIFTTLFFKFQDEKLVYDFGLKTISKKLTMITKSSTDDVISTIYRNKPSTPALYILFKTTHFEAIKVNQLRAKIQDESKHIRAVYLNSIEIPNFELLPIFSLGIDISTKEISIQCIYKPHYFTFCTVMNSEQEYGRFTTKMILHSKRLLKFVHDRKRIIILKSTMEYMVDTKSQIYLINIEEIEAKQDNQEIDYIDILQKLLLSKLVNFQGKHTFSNDTNKISNKISKIHTVNKSNKSIQENIKHPRYPPIIKSQTSRGTSRIGERTPVKSVIKIKLIRPHKKCIRDSHDVTSSISNQTSSVPLSEYISQATEIVRSCNYNKKMSLFQRVYKKFKLSKITSKCSIRQDAICKASFDESPLYLSKTISDRKLKKSVSYISSINKIRDTLKAINTKRKSNLACSNNVI